jgi:hypothetical protein
MSGESPTTHPLFPLSACLLLAAKMLDPTWCAGVLGTYFFFFLLPFFLSFFFDPFLAIGFSFQKIDFCTFFLFSIDLRRIRSISSFLPLASWLIVKRSLTF